MSSLNPANERLKHEYCEYLRHSEGLADSTIDLTLRSIADFELFAAKRDFRKFRGKDAILYREHLLRQRQESRGSLATVHSKLMRLEKFFRWIAGLPGRKQRISYAEIRCLGLSRKDQVKARQIGDKPTPTLEQVRCVIAAMPAQTDVDLRNRAVVATLLLTAVRIKALTTLKLKHFDVDTLCLDQTDPDVDTKGGQPIKTFLMPLDDDIQAILTDYVRHLRAKLAWTDEDPLFPATDQAGQLNFTIDGHSVTSSRGDFTYLPRGTVHGFKGASESPARVLIFAAPAHGSEFFHELSEQIRSVPDDLRKIPGIGKRHGVEFMPPQTSE